MDPGLSVVATGLSHHTASLSVRERVSLSAEQLPDALHHLRTAFGNGVILSTCNRTEIYLVADRDRVGHSHALELFARATGAGQGAIEEHTYYYRDEEAVRHLHRVASGMDAMILGEVEILGQVRSAMMTSFEAGLLTSVLDRLLHSALRAGRRIHAETFLGRHDRSVATAAMAMARCVLADVPDSRVLVLGAGDAGAMTIRTMLREGASDIRVANRTYDRAVTLAGRTGTVAMPLRRVPEVLCEVDLVVCASASPLLSKEVLLSVLPMRCRGPIVLIDLGVPRNIDPSVGDLPGVHLFDMDSLMSLCPSTPEDRMRDVANAHAILDEEVERFLTWWRSFPAVPTIAALEDSVEEARQREMAKTLRRVPSFDVEQREALDALTRALVKKVLHQPITRMKLHGDDKDYIAIGRELFGLENGTGRLNGRRNGSRERKRRGHPTSDGDGTDEGVAAGHVRASLEQERLRLSFSPADVEDESDARPQH
jgi:glutamyl-tRNA reductase